jgi:hypothetical protein
MDQGKVMGGVMEVKIMVKGEGITKEIIGESLFDCIDTAYRNYKGQGVELIFVKTIGYIDGDDLFVEADYLDRHSVKEIIQS